MCLRDANIIDYMNTELFIENCFAITTSDALEGRQHGRPDLNYWLEDENDPSAVTVSMGGNEPQELNIEWVEITYGSRPYFLCSCGLRVSKLYLPHNGNEFKCRKCHGLQYQLTTFNRYSIAGRELYKANRFQKLIASRESMGRILYNGNYTKKFERFIGLCERAGFNDIVKGANDLKLLIKG